MISKDVTITSKNQVTLPVKFVNKLNLSKGRILHATMQGDKIILTSSSNTSAKMKQYWVKRDKAASLSDAQLKQATRSVIAKRLSK